MEKTEPPKGPELFSPIDQKVFDARQAILEGKYDVAIKKCQDILDLNPNDITALKIMGSAFFLLDDHTRARNVGIGIYTRRSNGYPAVGTGSPDAR